MAEVKISELTSATTPLAGTETVPIVQGGVTKQVAVSEIGGGGGTAWGDITGTLSSQTDLQNVLDNKQNTLVSGTNIKTINGSSVLGSGNLTISGGSGLQGVYNIIQGQSGNVLNNRFFGTSTSFQTYTNNIIKLHPYISNYTFTTSSIGIQVLTGQAGANTRILIYSNSASKPNTKLYESATINCSTSGIKTAITSFTFTAGEVYWVGFQNSFSSTSASISSVTSANLPPFIGDSASNAAYIGYQTSAYSFGSAPTTMGTVTGDNTNYILLWLTIA